jgi:transcriptional regulator with XRE-family HTH domain
MSRHVKLSTRPADLLRLQLQMAEHKARVGARILEARLAKGWSQAELARHLPGKVDGPSVSRWELGKVYPERYLDHLASVLEVDVSFFLTPAAEAESPGDLMAALSVNVEGGEDRVERLEKKIDELTEMVRQLAQRDDR